MIHGALAEDMFSSIPPASVLRPPTLRLNNRCSAPWHGLDEGLHHIHPLTTPYRLQYPAVLVFRFYTLRCMCEQLLKSLVEACLEVWPQVFGGLEIK